MKISEMNSNQKSILVLCVNYANSHIGGLENSLQDEEFGSEEYFNVESALSDVESLEGVVLAETKRDIERIKHLKFEGNDFLEKVVRYAVKKALM